MFAAPYFWGISKFVSILSIWASGRAFRYIFFAEKAKKDAAAIPDAKSHLVRPAMFKKPLRPPALAKPSEVNHLQYWAPAISSPFSGISLFVRRSPLLDLPLFFQVRNIWLRGWQNNSRLPMRRATWPYYR